MWINREDKIVAEMSDKCFYCGTDKELCNKLTSYRESNKRIRVDIFECDRYEPLNFGSGV